MAKVIKGEDLTFTINLKNSDGSPYDLTGTTSITAKIDGTTGTIQKTTVDGAIVIVAPLRGEISLVLSDTDTSAMKVGTTNLELLIDVDTTRRIVQISKAFNVVAPLFA